MLSRIRRAFADWLLEDIILDTVAAIADQTVANLAERIATLETLQEDTTRRVTAIYELLGAYRQQNQSFSAVVNARLDSLEANDAVINASLRTMKADIDRAFASLYDVRKDLEKPDTFWLRAERIDDHGHE